MATMGFLQNKTSTKQRENDTLIVDDTFRHSYCVGQTGCGKTSSFIYPNLDDRLSKGHGVLIFDYKGKEHASVKYLAEKHNRLEDIIELGIPWGKSCNLIQYFNEKELGNFVTGIMNLNEKDAYWSTTASNLVISVWKIIKAYIDVISATEDYNIQGNLYSAVARFRLPARVTFADIAEVLSSHENIVRFISNTKKIYERFSTIIEANIHELVMKVDSLSIQESYLGVVSKNIAFKNILNEQKKSLQIFTDSKNASNQTTTIQTILLSMSTTFASVANNKSINDYNGIEIANSLSQGKVVILNAQEFPDIALATLTSSILQELSKRVQQKEIRGVSIFIDEAQRVLNKDFGSLHSDVLRESKVELFLAFQNHQLMINKLGSDQFYALIQNLSSAYVFANSLDFQDFETSNLETFEYYHKKSDRKYIAKPFFLDHDAVFEAVLKYCKINKLYDYLGIPKEDQHKIVHFNPYLYQQNLIELKSKEGDITVMKLRDADIELNAKQMIDTIIKNYSVKLRKQNVTSRPSLMSYIEKREREISEFLDVQNE
ncbi:hypothetical protein [Sulfurimonas sp. NW9]|uniref:hypothetical protein n=1 Tax=Sulfurimonas sp. NW9 TaxID=2922728 RepID=UPI003DA8E653